MKNLKIRNKLLVTFGSIVAMFLITVIVCVYGLFYSGDRFKDFYEYSYPMSTTTIDIRDRIQTSIKALGLSMLTSDATDTQHYVDEVNTQMAVIRERIDYIIDNYRGDISNMNTALVLLDEAHAQRTEIENLALQNRNDEASAIFFNNYNPTLLQVVSLVQEMDETTTILADDTFDSARSGQTLFLILAVAISGLALLATLWLATYLSNSLTRPIAEIESVAKEMSEGKLDNTLVYTSKDELGELSDSMRIMSSHISDYMSKINVAVSGLANGDLNVQSYDTFLGDFAPVQMAIRRMVNSLNTTMTQINQSADQVSSGSDQVSAGSQALSQGATEQASSVEELAATISEISDQTQNTARNALEARTQTAEASNEVSVCNDQMKKMISAMDDISQQSSEIGKIIKTIEDIAFQTNILALNAAVEAARAGAAGKGFAVVADEVRNLASKSAEASKNTAALIESTVHAVENGTQIASATARSLDTVVASTQAVSSIVDRISDAASQQAVSVQQVTQGIDQISGVVQTNSATAEESAAASEELSSQAQILKSLINQFKLRKEVETATTPTPQSSKPSPSYLSSPRGSKY